MTGSFRALTATSPDPDVRGDREQGSGGESDGDVLFDGEGGVEDERCPDAGDGDVRQSRAARRRPGQLEAEEDREGGEPDVERREGVKPAIVRREQAVQAVNRHDVRARARYGEEEEDKEPSPPTAGAVPSCN